MEWKEELKMKKLTALLLALMMVFALAACGEEPAAESPAAESEAPAAESEEPAAESEEPAAESEEPAADDEADYANMSTEDLLRQLETYTDGCLTVATSPDFAPYEFYAIDENGEPCWPVSTWPSPSTWPTSWAWSARSSPWTSTASSTSSP